MRLGLRLQPFVYQAFFSMAYVLIAACAESLVLRLMLLAFLWTRRGRWWLAGVAAFLLVWGYTE